MSSAIHVLRTAQSFLGLVEDPPDSNRNPFGEWYGMNGVPWCAIFISYCLAQNDIHLPIQTDQGFHYCPAAVTYFKRTERWCTLPQPGDIVFFCWDATEVARHVGLVEAIEGGQIITIEGNTSPHDNCNGGAVMRRSRNFDEVLGFACPYDNYQSRNTARQAEQEINF